MKNWISAGFHRDQMLILNGEELIANPAKVMFKTQNIISNSVHFYVLKLTVKNVEKCKKIDFFLNATIVILRAQDFMGLEPLIKEENFVFYPEKGLVLFIYTYLLLR